MLDSALKSDADFIRVYKFLSQKNFRSFTKEDLFIKNFIKKGWGQDIAALSSMAEALSFATLNYPSLREQVTPLLDQTVEFQKSLFLNPPLMYTTGYYYY